MNRVLVVFALVSSVLLAGCGGPADDDGLDQQVESRGWIVDVTYPNGTQREYEVTSDPGLTDTDGDGLNDFQEFQETSDPRKIDTDDDRLLDGGQQCPDAGSELADKILEANILEHPEKDGCYLGEARWEYQGVSIRTQPDDAHSDNGAGIGDDIPDAQEIIGWNVTVSGRTYHVFSNPSTQSPDSDSDGLHDGHERALKTDPQTKDTDGDGVEDFADAAPLGNLVVVARLDKIDLKGGGALGGGNADLRMDVRMTGLAKSAGPKSISSGTSSPNMLLKFDVEDQGQPTEAEPYGAGHWSADVIFSFWDARTSGDDQPIDVRNANGNANVLEMRYDAFADTWTGHAQGGTSSGPDAKVWIDLNTRVET